MLSFRKADHEFEKIGLKNVAETASIVQYERKERWGIHCIDILYKTSGEHIIQSYQKGTLDNFMSYMCGMTHKEARLAIKKMKEKGWR